MRCSYDPGYQVALPAGHPFPISKYLLLKDQLLAEGVLAPEDLVRVTTPAAAGEFGQRRRWVYRSGVVARRILLVADGDAAREEGVRLRPRRQLVVSGL